MNVGEQNTFPVYARQFWNDSGIDLVKDASYLFNAQGTWLDLIIPCGPDGYTSLLYQKDLENLLRLPNKNWFMLCGALDQGEHSLFGIGSSYLYKANNNGRLFCFANDMPGWYWNNFMSIQVSIKRVS
ncbi:hypothetical protein ACH50O_17380 [Methylomonas sp. 2BW1-5-20]|uniref:hypothetical protein n=1 Tax=Methylomonas sp. 2BW1-5-20 TaxID=3376686 RepID=UPI00404D8F79